MGLDIRIPIGFMFSIIGAILAGFGVYSKGQTDLYTRSLDININLWWGIILLVFGGLMLLGTRMKKADAAAK